MFAVDGTIEGRRACVRMIARSKEHGRGFRTSYYEHTGASGFNHSINGKYGNIIMGLILMIRKVYNRMLYCACCGLVFDLPFVFYFVHRG